MASHADTSQTEIDHAMMRHALALASRGLGQVAPNPAVGAVIWKLIDGAPVIFGRGFTQKGGRPHAETEALKMAGDAARGASMAVTLEPCSHHGKTPPCANAIMSAGITRIVSALEDPDPRVSGRGHKMLRDAGIELVTGICTDEAYELNLGFILHRTLNRPIVTLKLAETADGFAGVAHQRLMITGGETQAHVHLMRAQHDAIMVGIGTVLADDPSLTCRLAGLEGRSPQRVIIDTHLRIPLDCVLVKTARDVPTIVITSDTGNTDKRAHLAAHGIDFIDVTKSPNGHADLQAALNALAARGITRLFVEGGPMLAEALAKADLVDRAILITNAKTLNGSGIPAKGPVLAKVIADAHHFTKFEQSQWGDDSMTVYRRAIR
jgi:diaminohydroxyphosphoribosylaminopyrimidine deaminase/5-amino-6-(5-phosphoribosylamino)uracil reductase